MLEVARRLVTAYAEHDHRIDLGEAGALGLPVSSTDAEVYAIAEALVTDLLHELDHRQASVAVEAYTYADAT